MVYDCIIVGGGPAGAICSLLLQMRGFKCILFEKRYIIDEKICGGFIPDSCRNLFLQCGVELSEMIPAGNCIKGYVETRIGTDKTFLYENGKYGFGVFRKNLDSFLLKKTQEAGTNVIFGENVSEIARDTNIFCINGIEGKYVVWATGATPPLRVEAFEQIKVCEASLKQSVGISEIVSVAECKLENNCVYFWYEEISNDYFWAIPIGENIWNIGYWSQNDRKNVKSNFILGKKRWIESNCREIYSLRSPKGALLGNADFSTCIEIENFFCCGDFAGSNNLYTGEGIAQAVQSAQKTADVITKLLKGEM